MPEPPSPAHPGFGIGPLAGWAGWSIMTLAVGLFLFPVYQSQERGQ